MINFEYTERRLRSKFGWLSPRGCFVHCEYGRHRIMAQKLRGKAAFLPPVGRFSHNKSEYKREEELEELGWIKISHGQAWWKSKDGETYVTQDQYNFLMIYLEFYNLDNPVLYLDLRIK